MSEFRLFARLRGPIPEPRRTPLLDASLGVAFASIVASCTEIRAGSGAAARLLSYWYASLALLSSRRGSVLHRSLNSSARTLRRLFDDVPMRPAPHNPLKYSNTT